MTDSKLMDLAEEALEIYGQGIEVSLKKGDLKKVFVAVIAANAVTGITILGLKVAAVRVLRKYKPELLEVKKT